MIGTGSFLLPFPGRSGILWSSGPFPDSIIRAGEYIHKIENERRRKVSVAQRFTQAFGIIYVVVGIAGFIPPLLFGSLPPGIIGPFAGFLLALFAVNWFHSLAHLAIGAAGVALYRNHSASKAYALVLGVAYAGLFVFGLIWGLSFLGGLMLLNGWDHVLHIATAAVAFGAYFVSKDEDTTEARGPAGAR